jgi:nucleotide-binding universal stress UspA family protein
VDEAQLRHATVQAVHVWEPPMMGGYPYTTSTFDPRSLEGRGREVLAEAVDAVLDEADGVKVEPVGVCGSPAAALIERTMDADLVVVGSRGLGGFAGLLLGSVSEKVARHAACPVVIVRN